MKLSSLELKVPPLVFGLGLLLLMWWTGRIAPSFSFPIPNEMVLCSAIVGIAGAGVIATGIITFRKARTTIDPRKPEAVSRFVTSGIYRHTRNPMYLGFLLILIAAAIYFHNFIALLLLPGFVLYMNRFQILPEEQALGRLFPKEFSEYRARVRRWI